MSLDDPQTQPMVEHLIELRSRLLRALLIVLLVFLALFGFANQLYEFVAAPLLSLLPAQGGNMIATEVASPFMAPFKLSLFAAVVLSIPFIFYQLWRFVCPALYQREKKILLPLFFSSVLLFYAGMAFAYFVVFPLIFGFFTSSGPDSVTVMTDISSYLNLVIKLFFAFGLAFEIPVATVILISAGVLTPETLSEKRPFVIVGCFVAGMLLTPPDIISQALLAVPMWLLYEIGLLCGRMLVAEKVN